MFGYQLDHKMNILCMLSIGAGFGGLVDRNVKHNPLGDMALTTGLIIACYVITRRAFSPFHGGVLTGSFVYTALGLCNALQPT